MFAKWSLVILIATFMVGCRSYDQDPFPGNALAGHLPPMDPVYEVRSGDILGLRFSYHPEWNEDVTVRVDGKISVALAGILDVKGLSVEGVTELIRDGVAKQIKDQT